MKVLNSFVALRANTGQFDDALGYYERLWGERSDLRFRYEPGQLDIATVGPVVLIGGSHAALAAAPSQAMVISVDSLIGRNTQ